MGSGRASPKGQRWQNRGKALNPTLGLREGILVEVLPSSSGLSQAEGTAQPKMGGAQGMSRPLGS